MNLRHGETGSKTIRRKKGGAVHEQEIVCTHPTGAFALRRNVGRSAGEEGKVAGVLLNMPYDDMAKQQGFVSLVSARDILDTFLATTWVGRRAWAAKNADLLVRFIRAYSRSIDWLSDPSNQKEAVTIVARHQKVDEDVAAKRLAQEMDPATATVPKAAIDVKGVEAVIRLRAEAGLLKTPVPPAEKYYDLTYYNRAVRK
jgi:ABC-type nitrate/sulfonate/bicarbonate transport system substrate-binding protein